MDLRLRPFPNIALRVMRLTEREDVHMGRLATLVESDPAFSTEVLTVANGWMYARREPIASVRQAVSTLGIRRLQGLCLTVGVRTFLGKSLQMPITRALWRHSVATALIAEELARQSEMDPDIAYTAGLLHDIGRLGLMVAWPKAYATLLDTHYGSPASILELEAGLFGADHCSLSNLLIRDWELPSALFAGHHHGPRLQEWNQAELVKMSCRLADAAGMTAFPGCFIGDYADLLTELPETCQKHFPAEIESHRSHVNSKLEALDSD
ncbi:MAG TPA: HDOD domain-containing protein [Acidobacteriaceae bacterium]|jgi:HD-like signal output (HDOD) protein|nr:HDOD domain-containing protein [Acidobacteriaceae bacterium]